MSRPHALNLSDEQLRLVQQGAAALPVVLRDLPTANRRTSWSVSPPTAPSSMR